MPRSRPSCRSIANGLAPNTEFSGWAAVNCSLKLARFGALEVVFSRFGKTGPAANYGACVRFRL